MRRHDFIVVVAYVADVYGDKRASAAAYKIFAAALKLHVLVLEKLLVAVFDKNCRRIVCGMVCRICVRHCIVNYFVHVFFLRFSL